VDLDGQQKLKAIMRILAETGRPLGSTTIAAELQAVGIDLQQRMVRYYLSQMDSMGLTENLGRAGRRLTAAGLANLRAVGAVERVGFVSARVDELAYRQSFELERLAGTVVLNVSRVDAHDFPASLEMINLALGAGMGMGRLIAVGRQGDQLGDYLVPPGVVAVGTICSVTLNGVFRAAGIPVSSRFGGLLEVRDGKPSHFTHVIHYDGTTIDPVEIFIKGKMTRVRQAAATGTGTIGASFREIPAAALAAAGELIGRLSRIGLLGGFQVLGRPGQPLLDIPVSQGRVGLIVPAGLNALAAVEEAGIDTRNVAMSSLFDYARLIPADKA
jgi:repressor of nif and glnA expression